MLPLLLQQGTQLRSHRRLQLLRARVAGNSILHAAAAAVAAAALAAAARQHERKRVNIRHAWHEKAARQGAAQVDADEGALWDLGSVGGDSRVEQRARLWDDLRLRWCWRSPEPAATASGVPFHH